MASDELQDAQWGLLAEAGLQVQRPQPCVTCSTFSHAPLLQQLITARSCALHPSCSQSLWSVPPPPAIPWGKWPRQTGQAAVGLPTTSFLSRAVTLWCYVQFLDSGYTFMSLKLPVPGKTVRASYSIIARSKAHWLLCNSPSQHAKGHMLLEASVIRAWELQSRSQLGLCFFH